MCNFKGAGRARNGLYANYSDEDMQKIRKVALIQIYSFVVYVGHIVKL
ncbi:MAG TPA: hypothetical protein VIK78_01285 [Ruminiclostridium sp.]